MRRVLVLALLALALPMAAWADIILVNQNGSVSISDMSGTGGLGTIGATTIDSTGSLLTQWAGVKAAAGHSLGSVSFSTGVLLSGSVRYGGTFSDTGSTFDVYGVGQWAKKWTGCPSCKNPITLFSGGFYNGPILWSLTSAPGAANLTYTLTGDLIGQYYNGRTVTGTTTQNLYSVAGQLNGGTGHIRMGGSTIIVPEPGTLGLLGTGLLGIAGMFRRKLIGS